MFTFQWSGSLFMLMYVDALTFLEIFADTCHFAQIFAPKEYVV